MKTIVAIKKAKKHWIEYTKKVLSNEVLQSFKKGEVWVICNKSPTVCSLDGKYQLAFKTNGQGHIFCERIFNRKIAQYFQ